MIVKVSGLPVHITPLFSYVGVTTIVATNALVVSFVTTNEGIVVAVASSGPLSANPIAGLSLVQVYVVVPSVLIVVNSISSVVSPTHKT